MRVWLPSLNNDGHTRFVLNDDFSFRYYDISSDGTAIETIAAGTLTDCRFQILFEIALNHFAREQFRDSVVAAYAALERFREYYLLVGFLEKDYSESLIKEFWSQVGSQSERQLGAYHSMVLLREGSVAQDLKGKYVKYRNKVIHQGIFPDKKPTEDYLKAILELINRRLLSQTHLETLEKAKKFEYESRKPEDVTMELSINPLLDLNLANREDLVITFQQRIEKIQDAPFEEEAIIWPYT